MANSFTVSHDHFVSSVSKISVNLQRKTWSSVNVAQYLNELSDSSARQALSRCCASENWVAGMLAARPFASPDAVEAAASQIASQLVRDDWLQAFAAHPRIGDLESLREKYSSTRRWASGEQSGVAKATEATIQELARLNHQYVERFGYIFIVCATGKSADQMLAILRGRLPNRPDDELLIAAQEQQKITLVRLRKLAPSAP